MLGKRGLASPKITQSKRLAIASMGGKASPTKFKPNDPRTRMAGHLGGLARYKNKN